MSSLFERVEKYEDTTNFKLLPKTPVYARLDGCCFKRFTSHLDIYDKNMINVMKNVTKYILKLFNANIAYTQSDEINLIWFNDKLDDVMMYDRRIQKLSSIMAAKTSVKFNQYVSKLWENKTAKMVPTFDCRLCNIPNFIESINMLVKRELDGFRNSVYLHARKFYSQRELNKKNSKLMLEMMLEKGFNWYELPREVKYGSIFVLANNEEERKELFELVDLPELKIIKNKIGVLMYGEEPEINESQQKD